MDIYALIRYDPDVQNPEEGVYYISTAIVCKLVRKGEELVWEKIGGKTPYGALKITRTMPPDLIDLVGFAKKGSHLPFDQEEFERATCLITSSDSKK